MKHAMKLNPSAFEGIRTEKQKYETRLFDEKRRSITLGDTIVFAKLPELKESIELTVTNIITARDFEELFQKFDPKEANWPTEYTHIDCANAMLKYYSHEDQLKHGVVAFELHLNAR
ncbi:hypothetical protein KAZ57_04040 [Patescibacteria group bacterium]|nr:hypothetical protein [Patescibacteria group bacterium]